MAFGDQRLASHKFPLIPAKAGTWAFSELRLTVQAMQPADPKGEPLFQKHLGPGLRRDEGKL
jgi:hypothetical protein